MVVVAQETMPPNTMATDKQKKLALVMLAPLKIILPLIKPPC